MQALILTLFPEMFPGTLGHSLAGKALDNGLWALETLQIRDFATDKHKTVDEKSYGGGTGLVMRPDVVGEAIDEAQRRLPNAQLIYPSPRGAPFTQEMAWELVNGRMNIPPPSGGRLGGGQVTPKVPTEARTYPFKDILKNSKELRKNLTDAEQKLWQMLRRKNFGVKFRRQHPIGKYIADFACLEPKLIIELDGGQHNQTSNREYDDKRSEFLESQGFEVLRFWNNDVIQNFEGVLEVIYNKLHGDTRPLPSPPPNGEGNDLILLCGRYEGVDQRVLDHYQPLEISLGDYVLSGGEIAAQVILDACLRLIPGVISKEEAVETESFSLTNTHPACGGGSPQGKGGAQATVRDSQMPPLTSPPQAGGRKCLLEYPQYTQPSSWRGMDVPEVLLSGNHKKIRQWRAEQAQKITQIRRPDLLSGFDTRD